MFHCARFHDTVLSYLSVVGTSVRAVAMLVLLVVGNWHYKSWVGFSAMV